MDHRSPDFSVTERLRRCLEQPLRIRPDWAAHGLDQPVIGFTSRAEPGTPTYLVRNAALVREVLADATGRFSNRPYAELGGGDFMLAMDGLPHDRQRHWVIAELFGGRAASQLPVQALARLAWDEASVLALKSDRFDAVALAREAALRFCAHLFGFPQQDLPLLGLVTQGVYDGLVHVILGRHIGLSPLTGWRRSTSARPRECVLQRVADHAHLRDPAGSRRRTEPDDLARCAVLQRELHQLRADLVARGAGPAGADFLPLCARLSDLPGEEQAAIVLGLIGGTIGNVQTSVALIVDRLLDAPADPAAALRRAAHALQADTGIDALAPLREAAWATLAAFPPVAFLPRQVRSHDLVLGGVPVPAGANLVLWLGEPDGSGPDWRQRVFTTPAPHDCIGDRLVMPLLLQLGAGMLRQPGLARDWDEPAGREQRLDRRWHFAARTLPLRQAREAGLRQQPLCVVMDVREPVAQHGRELARLIACAAPLIEQSLLESRHIHTAWFVLFNAGRQLALFTTYDGSFDAYIAYFADRVGPLFDLLFAHIVDAPVRRPIGRYPKEFVARIRKAHALHAPMGGYFFSAYPQQATADVQAADAWWRQRLGLGPRQRPLGQRPGTDQPVARAAHDALLAPSMSTEFEPARIARSAGLRLALQRHPIERVRAALADRAQALRDEADGLHAVMRDDGGVATAADADPETARRRILELVDAVPARVVERLRATQGGRGAAGAAAPAEALSQPEAEALVERLAAAMAGWPGLGPTGSVDASGEFGESDASDASGAPLRLRHQPGLQRVHGPLCVVMNIKAPHADHARDIARVIATGAPTIERSLREAGHVHFAWFVLLDGGRQLALLTNFDGDLDTYVDHFANEVGDLFDRLFEHLDDPPPLPVSRHPRAFVRRIHDYHDGHAPVGGYFFSACPALRVADIQHAGRAWRDRLR
ncbi:hypothetical protein [Leptothrix discophora]|uniref:Cytochrome P450 n=1 Tax=Leptothrix discophora TaxID=89 RepID=A0ABT9G3L4_LEPDI|nr:hypothetical protein [Leptothrix discophora]MDP4301071.1 hypothetical protein [Leptothrix discophora]